ncbi:hypothetical protein N2152v2_003998 [Parachlorella kessleri]
MDYERLLGNSNGEPMHRSSILFRKRRKKLMRATVVLSCLALLVCQLPLQTFSQRQASTAARLDNQTDHFVQVVGGEFVVGCQKFYISGWNQWEVVEAAAGALELFGASLPEGKTGPQLIRSLMDKAVQHGLTVMRAWAHPVTAQYAMETAPGQYNEAVFRGLDYALDEARKRGLRVLLSLTDNWQLTGGADQFVTWAKGNAHEDFFSDPTAKQLYKDHVKALLTRVNTINGRVYKDDPTIFALDLINEPRCYRCGNGLELWVNEMAAYVKSIDSRHLLTVGEEGFYPQGLQQSTANPQGATSWAFFEGQNFPRDHSSPNIDFVSVHLWWDNWEDKTTSFAQKWIRQHIADAAALGKPLLLEEFGKCGSGAQRAERDQYMLLVYDEVAASATVGGPAKGALFWQWYDEGQRAPAEEGGTVEGLFGIFDTDSTWSIIQNFTDTMNALSGDLIAACAADAGAVLPVIDACVGTRVEGRPDTGFEGPRCTQDINECVRGTSGCHPNATCTNTNGGYSCLCPPGFTGNGFNCSQDETAHRSMLQRYTTQGPGKIACQEGQDVVYPQAAPGYAYDPIGALEQSPATKASSRRTATAAGCDSFAYNPEQRKCFLKSGASSTTCQAKPTTCTSARGNPYSCGTWQTYFQQQAGNNEAVDLVPAASPNGTLAERLASVVTLASPSPGPGVIQLVVAPSPSPSTPDSQPALTGGTSLQQLSLPSVPAAAGKRR